MLQIQPRPRTHSAMCGTSARALTCHSIIWKVSTNQSRRAQDCPERGQGEVIAITAQRPGRRGEKVPPVSFLAAIIEAGAQVCNNVGHGRLHRGVSCRMGRTRTSYASLLTSIPDLEGVG